MKYKLLCGTTLLVMVLASCGEITSESPSTSVIDSELPSTSISSSTSNTGDYYSDISSRVKFNEKNPLNFFDTMNDGLDDNVWYTLDGAWHNAVQGAEHNGVRKRNLFYAKDGDSQYLAIKGRGFYNKSDSSILGKPEGGCILTKNHLTPGRYEINMAAMPREGGVTAMWTYCTTTGSELTSQNEIDIEIGGTTGSTQFADMWCTSWTKSTVKETSTVDMSKTLFMNDGVIHKYTFDWYTDYLGKGIKRVDWFIDGVYIKSIEGNVVPEYEMPLWVAVWFPPLWAGNASFVEDYLVVKDISFTAFEASQWFEDCRSEPGYTKGLPSEAGIQTIQYSTIKNVNKLSNVDFESLDKSARDSSYYGWNIDSVSKGSVALSEQHTQGAKSFALSASTDTSSKYHGEYLKQTITNAYEGYKYDFSIDAKKLDEVSSGNIEFYYKNSLGTLISSEKVPVSSTSFGAYSKQITMPKNAFALEIDITSEEGTVLYDNASLVFKGI